MQSNDANLHFKGNQRKRSSTSVIVIHHTGESVLQSVEVIHDYYLHRVDPDGSTYIGIAYHYYTRKDGSVWKGRNENAIGGHAGAVENPISIGICFEGNFETEQMGDTQRAAGQALIADILTRYPGLEIKKHKDYRNTDCPGVNFPFDAMLNTAPIDFPGAQYFGAGKDNEYILMLDKALIAKEYAGYYKLGAAGASTLWGAGSQKACTAFQLDQGWSGSGADGIPGPLTWQRLFH